MTDSTSATGPGGRIAQWRKTLGWSQQRLADELGISRGYLGDVEAGRSDPSGAMLTAITSAADVSVDWILTGRGEMLRQRGGAEGAADHDQDGAADHTQVQGSAYWARRLEALAVLLDGLQPEHREAILADALSRAASAQQLAELGQALADLRESLKSGAA